MSSLYVVFKLFTECIIHCISEYCTSKICIWFYTETIFYAHCKYFIYEIYVIGETKLDDWKDRRFGHIAKYRSQRMILDDTLTQDTLA